MTLKVGINGFGRMGRLTFRCLNSLPGLEVVAINDPGGPLATFAHLLEFDSVHGRWPQSISANGNSLIVNQRPIVFSHNNLIPETDWRDCHIVIEASGKFNRITDLHHYLEQGVKQVVVTAPVKEEGALNLVMGVNHTLFDPALHPIVTAASCTTNCLAPVVKVIHEALGIKHGSMTTLHSITNTQTIIDAPHKDLRRARACGQSLIPTTTGSATAITHIFPELKGKLNGHAVRVPLTNASLTDCVFEVNRATNAQEVNRLLEAAANTTLKGILGYETRPLVSIDYQTDPRSCIIDALSTLVVNDTHVKIYAWYDNEWGYVNRTTELVQWIANSLQYAPA